MTVAAKILGGLIVIFSTSAYGYLMSTDLKKRLSELMEIKKMIFLLKGEISFGMTPIFDAAGSIAARFDGVMGKILMELESYNRKANEATLGEIWRKVFQKGLADTHLSENEKDRLICVGDGLGLADSQTQASILNVYIDELDSDISQLKKILPAKTRLYQSLGVMLGIIITIIMV